MLKKLVAGVAMLSLMGVSAEACTVMIVTKGASEDGSVIVSHSNDGRGAEMNLVFVPAKDHPKDSMRPVYPTAVALDTMPEYNAYDQPNLVAPERSDDYDYPDRPHTRPIGFIPEVEHTYAYMDADYGIVNEHGLMFGECTDMSAHLPEVPFKEGGGKFSAVDKRFRRPLEGKICRGAAQQRVEDFRRLEAAFRTASDEIQERRGHRVSKTTAAGYADGILIITRRGCA